MAMTGLGLRRVRDERLPRPRSAARSTTRFSIRGNAGPPPKDIVVVKVDDKTFSDLQKRREDFRPLHAELIDAPQEGRREGDRLRRPVHRAVRQGHEEDDNKLINAVGDAGERRPRHDRGRRATGSTNVFGGDATSRRSERASATGTSRRTPAATIRRMRYEIAKLKTLAVAAAERATGKPVKPFGTTLDRLPRPGRDVQDDLVLGRAARQGAAELLPATRSSSSARGRPPSRTSTPSRSGTT